MRFPGQWRLRMAWHWLRSLHRRGALILGYHRVAASGDDPLNLCVRPEYFDEQLAILRRMAQPVSLARLVKGLADGDLPGRAVAVTFDDGYADNLLAALPLLERHEIPATCFVVGGGRGCEFWWDEAARLLRDTPEHRQPPGELVTRWAHLAEGERTEQLDTLRRARRVHAHGATARALDTQELRQLAGSALVEIGAHTMSHPMLTSIPLNLQQQEIAGSKAALEALLDRPVHGFSYPHGSNDLTTRALVRDAGFHYACASDHDLARANGNPYHLPRFWVEDWDGDRFARWLRWWLRG